jgi:hypothetical protein
MPEIRNLDFISAAARRMMTTSQGSESGHAG